ncbi:MAG TPA: HemK/PrmC family methyltransferase [bacterium]
MKELIRKVSSELNISRSEAEMVVASLLDQPRFEMYFRDRLDDDAEFLLHVRLEQFKRGVPLEYLTKRVQFMDLSLHIAPGVFIPRLETEYFVTLIGQYVPDQPLKILDIGTGCGALAISLARQYPGVQVIATDISRRALDSARINCFSYGVSERVSLVQTDMLNALNTAFDLIVSNPPYVPSERLGSLPRSVKEFEPLKAIDGGGTCGTGFIRALIDAGMHLLAARGIMAIEIDEDQAELLDKIIDPARFRHEFKNDQFGRVRYLFLKRA